MAVGIAQRPLGDKRGQDGWERLGLGVEALKAATSGS